MQIFNIRLFERQHIFVAACNHKLFNHSGATYAYKVANANRSQSSQLHVRFPRPFLYFNKVL